MLKRMKKERMNGKVKEVLEKFKKSRKKERKN